MTETRLLTTGEMLAIAVCLSIPWWVGIVTLLRWAFG